MKKLLLYSACVFAMFSCSEENIPSFEGSNQIYFEKFYMDELPPAEGKADSTIISTFNYPEGTKTIQANIIVCQSGMKLEKDSEYLISVVEDETTADKSEYSLPEPFIFHAGEEYIGENEIKDTLFINLHVSDRLASLEEGVCIVLEIKKNENFDLGHYEKTKSKIIFTTNQIKPEWWTEEVEKNLLGEYSIKKYKLFLTHVDTNGTMSNKLIEDQPDEARLLAIEFKKWLNENPQIEENGAPMIVTI